MTDEDKKAEANGELVFSWGSDEVEIIEVQNAIWTKDGVHYSLMQLDGKLSADELADMAAEVIENKYRTQPEPAIRASGRLLLHIYNFSTHKG